MSYMILQRVTPVTHSIGNCVKRVIVIIASVLVFQNPMSLQNKIGKCNPVLCSLLCACCEDCQVLLDMCAVFHVFVAMQELLLHFLGSSATLKPKEWGKRRLHNRYSCVDPFDSWFEYKNVT